jgi:predicted dehydrogenase
MRARLAVIGLGRMGRLHAANLAGRVASASLAGVADPVEPLARGAGERHGVPWWTSAEEALEAADGVVIAAPTALHGELVALAADAGRHVFCEKPLGFDSASARAAADAGGALLQVGFQRRFDPDWTALEEALDAGELGALRLFRCSHRDAFPPGDDLGALFADMAVHDLDAARWLGGEVAEAVALARGGAGAAVALRFESGALGAIDVSRDARYGFECSAEVVGSRATMRIGYGHRRGGAELLRDGRASAWVPVDHAERHGAAYVAELDHFGEVVLGRRAAHPTGADAVAALELAELMAEPVAP